MLLSSWLLFPTLLVAFAIGIGLLVRRLSGNDVEPLLIVPIGLLAIIVVATAGTWFGATAAATTPLLIVLAVAGVAQARRELRAAIPHWRRAVGPGLAAAAAFACFGASSFLSGQPTFTGYTEIVDIGHQFDMASYLSQHGRALPTADSSSLYVVRGAFGVGYPSGAQAPLGVLSRFFSFEIAWVYQSYLAVFAAAMVAPMVVLLRDVVAHRGLRLAAAFVATQSSLLIAYAQVGGLKELMVTLALLVTAALLNTFPGAAPRTRPSLAISVAVASAFAVLSLAVASWLGLLLLAAFVVTWRHFGRLRDALASWVPQWLLMALLSLPTLAAATQTGPAAEVTQNNADLGNLAAPVSVFASAGIWLTGDHRFPLTEYRTLTTIGIVIALGLAVLGAVSVVRRRSTGLGLLAIAAGIAFPVMLWRFGPWVDFKAIVISGPVVLALAMAGAGSLLSWKFLRPLAFVSVSVVGALVLFANALRYNEAALAPYDRLRELEQIGQRYATAERTLYPDFEELAEYFLRRGNGVSPVNPADGLFAPRPEIAEANEPGPQFRWDLDQLDPASIERFDTIVLRQSAAPSRPPSNFERVYSGRFHDVWQRNDRTAPEIHAPLSGTGDREDAVACRRFVRQQRKQGNTVRVAKTPEHIVVDPTTGSVSSGWAAPGPLALNVRGTGRATVGFSVPRNGTYDVYLGGSSVRSATLVIDGTTVGTVGNAVSYPGGAVRVGHLDLTKGDYTLHLVRPGGSLAPGHGDGHGRPLGPIWLVERESAREAEQPTVVGDDGRPADACTGRLDWLEAGR